MQTDLVLVKLDAARAALAEAKTIQETKKILDVARAAEIYAKRQELGAEAIEYATSIKVEALRQLGQMLIDAPKNRGAQGMDLRAVPKEYRPRDETPTYAEIGLDKKTAQLAQDVANLNDDKLDDLKRGVISLSRAQAELRRADKVEKIISNNAPFDQSLGTYNVLYVDPPWRYEHIETESRAIENHYPTMELVEIMNLPIEKIAADDCVLFLWATSPKLAEAMQVIGAWGFNYRTCAVWVKDKIGMGYYFRQRHELLLVATRGALPTPKPENRLDSVIESPRGEHSKKPDCVYSMIEQMYSEFAKCELFARNRRAGWAAWGNQAND